MTIELQQAGQPTASGPAPGGADGPPRAHPLTYKGVDIMIEVQRTPDCVFGHADLVEGDRYCGRLSIGNPRTTPEDVRRRLAALAQARVDIMRCAQRARSGPLN